MLELLPLDDETPSFLDELGEDLDREVDASFLGDLADVLERVKRAREQLASAAAIA